LPTPSLNLKQEIPHWSLEKERADAHAAWNKVLGLIEVKGGTDSFAAAAA
jgi:putative alpha-1,2-mannosidase